MSGKSTTISNIQPVAGNLRVQTAIYGSAIPIVYGRTRISGNLAWYGGFTAIAHTSTQKSGGKGGGGGVTQEDTSYTYTAAVLMCLSRGIVSNVLSAWKGKQRYFGLGTLGLGLATGGVGQPVWGYLASAYPSQALGYSGLAYAYASGYDLGADATVTNHSFEVSTPWECVTSGDANTALIAQDVLATARFPASLVGDYSAWSNYVLAQNLVMSPALTQQKPAADWLRYLLDLSNTDVIWSQGGLKFVPLGDAPCSANGASYTPDNTPVYDLTDDHFLVDDPEVDPLRPERKANEDTYNHVRLEFTNRLNQYNVETVEAKDAADIEQRGLRSKDVVEAHAVNDPQVAQLLVTLLLQRELAVRNTYKFSLPWTFGLLEPLDLVTVSDAYLSLTRVPVRITSISELDGGDFEVEAEDCPVGMANAPLYGMQAGEGFALDFNAPPGPVTTPFFLEAPVELTTTGLEVWAAVSGASKMWGGCNVWVSTDGISYRQETSVRGGARYGSLSAGFGVSESDALGVALVGQGGQLLSASASDAASNQSLVFVGDQLDGEYLNYQTATLTGPNAYTLTGLSRGAFRSVPQVRSAGKASAVRIDDAIVKSGPLAMSMVGQPLYFKFQSVNIFGGGTQSLDDLVAYSYTPTGYMLKLPPPDIVDLTISGTVLSWSPVIAADLAGYIFRFHYGSNFDWGTAALLHSGVITASPYDMVTRPAGVVTVMGKAIDTSGNESINAAIIACDLGDVPVANVVETFDFAATGYPGTLSGCSISQGALVAQAVDSAYGPDEQSFYGPDAAPAYEPGAFGAMMYVTPEVYVTKALAGSMMTLAIASQGDGLAIDYRLTGPDSFYGPALDSAYGADSEPFYGPPGAWQPWPGSLVAANTVYQLRVRIGAGTTQGALSQLALVIDAPDIVEYLEDVPLAIGGTTVPYRSAFAVIKTVTPSLQVLVSGATGIRIDKSVNLKPVLFAVNGSVPVAGAKADIILKGY